MPLHCLLTAVNEFSPHRKVISVRATSIECNRIEGKNLPCSNSPIPPLFSSFSCRDGNILRRSQSSHHNSSRKQGSIGSKQSHAYPRSSSHLIGTDDRRHTAKSVSFLQRSGKTQQRTHGAGKSCWSICCTPFQLTSTMMSVVMMRRLAHLSLSSPSRASSQADPRHCA